MKNFVRKNSKSYYTASGKSHKLATCIVGVAVVFVVFLVSHNWPVAPQQNITPSTEQNDSTSAENAEKPNFLQKTYPVTKVVDGDTIWVNIDGADTKIRFIGVNTPETVSTSSPVQCYGPESSNYTKSMLAGKYVALEADNTQGDKDKYGRLLRYVYIDDRNLNLLLIKNGYGFEYTYSNPYKYQDLFMEAENDAKNNLRGLWSPSACNGELRVL